MPFFDINDKNIAKRKYWQLFVLKAWLWVKSLLFNPYMHRSIKKLNEPSIAHSLWPSACLYTMFKMDFLKETYEHRPPPPTLK